MQETNKARYEQIYDSVRYKELMMQWASVQTHYHQSSTVAGMSVESFTPLILSRQLGHQEVRNSRHWKITDECYMCDRWKYTLIFWDIAGTGCQFQVKDAALEELLDQLVSDDATLKRVKETNPPRARAIISGTFTNWNPRRMLQIDEFCAALQHKTDVLNEPELRAEYAAGMKQTWRKVLERNLQYPEEQTLVLNKPDRAKFEHSNPPEIDFNQLFVYADFIKPGKHEYLITYDNVLVEPAPITAKLVAGHPAAPSAPSTLRRTSIKFAYEPKVSKIRLTSYHNFMGEAFLGDYKINNKINLYDTADRGFNKDRSVFKDWRMDRYQLVKDGFLEEVASWKVPNIVKDPEEQLEILDFMQAQSQFLKDLFIIRTASSNFPAIRWLNYQTLVSEWDIYSDDFPKDQVDRIYLAVTKNIDKKLIGMGPGHFPEKDMSRFQFYESLVRIANFKYKIPGHTPTTLEGLKILVAMLHKKYDNWQWQGWREQYLWTLEVDDLLRTNLVALRKLYKYFNEAKKTKQFYQDDAVDLFTREVNLELLPEQVVQAWGLSQMTVYNEFKNRKGYFEASLAEFLEFFCRLAMAKYKEGNTSLCQKIEKLMDFAFPVVNMKRKEVVIQVEYISCSEDELEPEAYFN